ncbi:MAG: class I SAM-dependent RNA methyltransferase [Ilumatobacteraceae bacterium]
MPVTNHPRRDGRETVVVEKMAAGGDGIAHAADGRVLFVEGGLPGERVVVHVHTTKKDFAKGVVTDVLDASNHRAVPPCPAVAAGCGGCQWQHVDADGQLALKRDIVVDALRRTAKLPDAEVAIGGAVPPWGYRTTMRFAVAPNGRLGLRAAGSHRVVVLDECPVAHPSLSALLPSVLVHGADEVSLRVSVTTGEVTALLIGGRRDARVTGLPGHAAVGPAAMLREVVAGASLRVSAASFFQSGPAAAELLVSTVRAACGPLLQDGGPVLDAYGGVGLFAAALPMAQPWVVESSASACADARANLPNATVECTSFEDWDVRPMRLVVADPARAGLGARGAEVVVATGAERVVLVSCDPVAMARDAALLTGSGYRHAGSTVLDLFPNTPHVEVVTTFDRPV